MPIREEPVTASRIRAQAMVTDIELATCAAGPNFVTAHIRERLREELMETLIRQTLQSEEVAGGRCYWIDVLVMTPTALVTLIQREAERLLKEAGYALP